MEASLESKAHFRNQWLEMIGDHTGPWLPFLWPQQQQQAPKLKTCETELTFQDLTLLRGPRLPSPNSLYSNCWITSCQHYSAQTLEEQWLLSLMLLPIYTAARHPSPSTNLSLRLNKSRITWPIQGSPHFPSVIPRLPVFDLPSFRFHSPPPSEHDVVCFQNGWVWNAFRENPNVSTGWKVNIPSSGTDQSWAITQVQIVTTYSLAK